MLDAWIFTMERMGKSQTTAQDQSSKTKEISEEAFAMQGARWVECMPSSTTTVTTEKEKKRGHNGVSVFPADKRGGGQFPSSWVILNQQR